MSCIYAIITLYYFSDKENNLSHIFNISHRLCREISFKFRTKLPHGLLVYHSVKDRPEGLNPYALYVIVEKGQLKVVHVFGKQFSVRARTLNYFFICFLKYILLYITFFLPYGNNFVMYVAVRKYNTIKLL